MREVNRVELFNAVPPVEVVYHLKEVPEDGNKSATVAVPQKLWSFAEGPEVFAFPTAKFPKPVIPEAVAEVEVGVPEIVVAVQVELSYLLTT